MHSKILAKHRRLAAVALAAALFLPACDLNVPPSPQPTTQAPTATIPAQQATTEPTATGAPELATSTTPAYTPTSQVPLSPPSSEQSTPGAAGPSPTITDSAKAGFGCLATGSDLGTIGEPFYPGMGNAGYDALHYAIDLSIDVDGNSISGTTTIKARAIQDLTAFDFDFLGLTISSLKENGQSATYTRKGQDLQITPTQPIKKDEEFSVEVSYSGVPGKSTEGGNTPATGWVKYPKGIYVASEPSGSATWYPVNDHPCDKAAYTLRITVPEPYVVAANGLLKSTERHDANTTYTWDTPNPVASYLVMINVSRFVTDNSTTASGLPIRSYFPPNMEPAAKAPFLKMGDMVDYFSSIYGSYPFEAYGAVVADTELNFALETQTMSLFGNKVGSRVTSEEAVAHELAHQWFGDSVSLVRWKDIWLNEGFATFSQWMWIAHSQSKAAFDDRIRQSYRGVADRKPLPPGSPPADDLFNMGVYIRGGLTLEALRVKIGDDTFFRTMRTYANRYKYGNAGTQDFIKVAEEQSGQNLSAFFDAWLYETALPEIPELNLKP